MLDRRAFDFPGFHFAVILLGCSLFFSKPAGAISPTQDDVAYGPHQRQVLDFYQAASERPTPVVVYLHGGGWVNGSEASVPRLDEYLNAGVSVVAVRYRYSHEAQLAGIMPPVRAPMEDAMRAVQFIRSKASQWNIDPSRIGATGNSAGACTSLWLALHDDMAAPLSVDPVARQSTRLTCAGIRNVQSSLDPIQMKQWTPNSRYGGGAFGFMDPHDTKTRDSQFEQFLASRERILPWIQQYSPIEHASPDDPPIYVSFTNPPNFGQSEKDPTHTANFGVALKWKLDEMGVPCELVYPAAPSIKHQRMEDFLIATLTFAAETVPLWSDEELGTTEPDNSEIRNQRGPNDGSVSNVNRPTLTIYHPTFAKNSGSGIVVCPGGGYGNVVVDKEGHDVARWLASQGVTAGVLKYRCGGGSNQHPIPMLDARQAVNLFRSRAKDWHVATDQIGIIGFSAGGHLAATIATDAESAINFAALIYPVISMADGVTHAGSKRNLIGESPTDSLVHEMSRDEQVSASTCPTFLVHASDDKAVPIENSLRFYEACRAANVSAEIHLYPDGGHGFGMYRGRRVSEQWPNEFKSWMTSKGWLESTANTVTTPRDLTDQLAMGAGDDEIVDHLLLVRKSAGTSRAIAIHFPDLDRDRAYRIQMSLLAKMEAGGERLAGWKMGGTKIVKLGDKLDPIFGFMLASDEYQSKSTTDASRFAADQPIMEAEVGFWIGKDLPGPHVSREQLAAAITGVGGAAEIISARLRDAQGGLEAGVNIGIADGLSHGGFILAKKQVRLDHAEFGTEQGRIEINGEIVAQGEAKIMMSGAPLDAVLSLANLLPKHGRYLQAGQVVIIGSMLDSPTADAGDRVEIGFTSFESLHINLK